MCKQGTQSYIFKNPIDILFGKNSKIAFRTGLQFNLFAITLMLYMKYIHYTLYTYNVHYINVLHYINIGKIVKNKLSHK